MSTYNITHVEAGINWKYIITAGKLLCTCNKRLLEAVNYKTNIERIFKIPLEMNAININ